MSALTHLAALAAGGTVGALALALVQGTRGGDGRVGYREGGRGMEEVRIEIACCDGRSWSYEVDAFGASGFGYEASYVEAEERAREMAERMGADV